MRHRYDLPEWRWFVPALVVSGVLWVGLVYVVFAALHCLFWMFGWVA